MERTVTASDGVVLAYRDLGPRESIPVVLCHGLAASGEQMLADAGFFADRGHRVLVPDLRGHGRSGKAEPRRESYGIGRMADDLVAILDHAGAGRVHWVGNSLGGILALALLANHEHRFATLATYGTAYRLDLPRWVPAFLPLGYRLLGPRLIGDLTAWQTTRHKPARPLIARIVARFDPMVGRLVSENLVAYDLTANARAARLPMLFVRCGRDANINRVLGPTLAAMADRPNIARVDLPEAGHCANLDATDDLRAALLAFWAANVA